MRLQEEINWEKINVGQKHWHALHHTCNISYEATTSPHIGSTVLTLYILSYSIRSLLTTSHRITSTATWSFHSTRHFVPTP